MPKDEHLFLEIPRLEENLSDIRKRNVDSEDVKALVREVLRQRLILNFHRLQCGSLTTLLLITCDVENKLDTTSAEQIVTRCVKKVRKSRDWFKYFKKLHGNIRK